MSAVGPVVGGRLEPHQVVAIVHDQAEADVVGAENVGPVDAEKALGVDRRTKEMRVHPLVDVVRETMILELRSSERRQAHYEHHGEP